MSNIEYRTFRTTVTRPDPETRAEGGNTGKVTGHAIVFDSDSVDMGFIERVSPTALDRTLADALNGWNVVALWEHDTRNAPLGSTRGGKLVLTKDERGLSFELDPARMTFAQVDAIRDGDMQMSFGFSVDKQTIEELDDGTIHRTLEEITLFEISMVQSPAYPATDVALRDIAAWKEARSAENADPVVEAVVEPEVTASEEAVSEPSELDIRRAKKVAYLEKRLSLLKPAA